MERIYLSIGWIVVEQTAQQGRGPPGTQAPPGQVPGDTATENTNTDNHDPELKDRDLSTSNCLVP